MNHGAISLQHPCLQPLPYETQKGPIIDTQLERGKKPVMVQVGEKALNINFNHIAVPAVLEFEGEILHGILRPFPRSIPITERKELLLIDCLQYLCHCGLKHLVFDAEPAD